MPAVVSSTGPGAGGDAVLPPDAELVARLRDRDEAAFTLLVDAWSAGMLRLARSFVATRESADEVLQDTWLAVLTGVAGFAGRSSLRTWTYRILVNTAKRRGERESRTVPWSSWVPEPAERDEPTVDPARFQGAGEPYPGHWNSFPAPWPAPESQVLAGEVRDRLAAALDGLPARQRIVITLRDVEGYTSDEVCSILDISAENQRVLLHRARATARRALDDYFASAVETDGREVTS
jgi:RNA polymerase sigma-70 factor, ECF subfamily